MGLRERLTAGSGPERNPDRWPLLGQEKRLQDRLERMYEDKLDGTVDAAFYQRKSAEWRQEQERILARIAEYRQANKSYFEDGVMLLDLARTAGKLFREQEPKEQRRLLDFVLSNSSWRDGELTAEYRQPFDMLAVARDGSDAPSRRPDERQYGPTTPQATRGRRAGPVRRVASRARGARYRVPDRSDVGEGS